MRNFLLASFIAATAVILSGEMFAGDQQLQSSVGTMAVNLADSRSNSETVVPSQSTFPKQIDRAQTIKSVEDITVTDQLRDLIENRLQQYVPQQPDRTAVEAFYRKRDFSPLWTGAGQLSRALSRRQTSFVASRPTASIRRTTRRRASQMPIRRNWLRMNLH
jgi:hypothetical protein